MSAFNTKTLMIMREFKEFPSKSHLDEIPFIITQPQEIAFILHYADSSLDLHKRCYKYKHYAIRYALLHAVGSFRIDLTYYFSSKDVRIIREFFFHVNQTPPHED